MALYYQNGGHWKEWIHLQGHDDPQAKDIEVNQEERSQTDGQDDSKMEDQEEDVEQKIEEDDPVGNQMSNSGGKADSSESEEK